jgi:hypothetical protein
MDPPATATKFWPSAEAASAVQGRSGALLWVQAPPALAEVKNELWLAAGALELY